MWLFIGGWIGCDYKNFLLSWELNMEERKFNCIKLRCHLGYFEYFCRDDMVSRCKCFDLYSRFDIECDIVERYDKHSRYSLDNKQHWNEKDISDLVEGDMGIEYSSVTLVSDIIIVGAKNEEEE